MNRIKEMAKKVPIIKNFYIKLVESVTPMYYRVAPIHASKTMHKKIFGRKLDFSNPETLNEKMQYFKFNHYWDSLFVAKCVDKYRVREYLEEKNCEELLIPLLGVWDDARKIDWDILPNKFVLKANHGSGFNIICKNKTELDKEKTIRTLNNWLKITYGYETGEQGIYRNVKPLIIAEKFIETADGLPPKDYKFFCSYGKVKLLFVASERVEDRTKFDYYYPDWTWIPVQNAHLNAGPVPKPQELEQMIAYAEKLSQDIPLVRVDFYEESGQIIFGELTFTHFGCVNKFEPESFDKTFGDLFPINKS